MNDHRRAGVLPVDFFARPADQVAVELLGTLLVSTIRGVRCVGRIVETEAYLGEHDAASHGYRLRRSPRNAALFGPPGNWYVYRSYGLHWCANLVCQREGEAAAVLLRAVEPMEGLAAMRRRRRLLAGQEQILCAGPGRLCQALGISERLNGESMPGSSVHVLPGDPVPRGAVLATSRVGITKASDWPLRFALKGSRWISRGSNG